MRLSVKLHVAGAQLLAAGVNIFAEFTRAEGETAAALLKRRLARLSEILGCPPADLRLDHNPALRIRAFNARTGKYKPDANDPEYLIYRTNDDHRRKTLIRGDGAQFSDLMLINRERKRERKNAKPVNRLKRGALFTPKAKVSKPIPRRVNPWPPKGSRPFRSA